jgi:transposase
VVFLGVDIDKFADAIVIRIRRRRNAKPRCPDCRRIMGGTVTRKTRRWRHLDVFRVRCELEGEVREATCPRHGRRVERVPWAAPAARHTHAFDRQIAALVQVADKSAAERLLRVAWRTVARMVERVVGDLLPGDRLTGLACDRDRRNLAQTRPQVPDGRFLRGHRSRRLDR